METFAAMQCSGAIEQAKKAGAHEVVTQKEQEFIQSAYADDAL